MEDLRYSCPICYGNVLFEDMANRRAAPSRESLATLKLYCPHCEMIVEPVITTAEERSRKGIGRRDAGTENRGRAREGGSNAGGSQRGDLSIRAPASGAAIRSKRNAIPGRTSASAGLQPQRP